jgi:hypothetical protein
LSAERHSAGAATLKPPAGVAGQDDSGLSWDDDELETQIYDNPEEEAAARAKKHGHASPRTTAPGIAAVAAEPDLSSLVSTAKGWEAPPAPAGFTNPKSGPTAPTLMGGIAPAVMPGQGNGANGSNGHGLASGSNKSQSPFLPELAPAPAYPAPTSRDCESGR